MIITNFSKFKTPVDGEKLKKAFKKFKEAYPHDDMFYFECEEVVDDFTYKMHAETDEWEQYDGGWRCFDKNDPRGIPYFIADRFEMQTAEWNRKPLTPEDLDVIERFLDTPPGKEEEAWDWFEPWAIDRGWMEPPEPGNPYYDVQVGLKK